MSEEKQLSLSDLGVEAVDTPAEKASRNAVNEKPNTFFISLSRGVYKRLATSTN